MDPYTRHTGARVPPRARDHRLRDVLVFHSASYRPIGRTNGQLYGGVRQNTLRHRILVARSRRASRVLSWQLGASSVWNRGPVADCWGREPHTSHGARRCPRVSRGTGARLANKNSDVVHRRTCRIFQPRLVDQDLSILDQRLRRREPACNIRIAAARRPTGSRNLRLCPHIEPSGDPGQRDTIRLIQPGRAL